MTVPLKFFEDCVFISVDIQDNTPDPDGPRNHVTELTMKKTWREQGRTPEDVNAARDFAIDVMLPNACKVADACRRLGLPMIFIHWGYQFRDAMDLDPDIRAHFKYERGDDPATWPCHIDDPESRPARRLDVREGEYVLAKTAMDAFISSNLDYVLRNLNIKNIVFVGGNTGSCHGKTVRSAQERGYRVLVVEDATRDAFESTRLRSIENYGYDYLVKTEEFLILAAEAERK